MPVPIRMRTETRLSDFTSPSRMRVGPLNSPRIVFRAPHVLEIAVAEDERGIVDDARRGEAVLEARRINEGLERGAGLALRLHRPVVAAGEEVEAAGQGHGGAVARGRARRTRLPPRAAARAASPGWRCAAGARRRRPPASRSRPSGPGRGCRRRDSARHFRPSQGTVSIAEVAHVELRRVVRAAATSTTAGRRSWSPG